MSGAIGFPSLEGLTKQPTLYKPFKELWDALTTVYFGTRYGKVTLIGERTVVRTPSARRDSNIQLTVETEAGTPGRLSTPPGLRVEGVSFTVVSSDATDRSVVAWALSNLK